MLLSCSDTKRTLVYKFCPERNGFNMYAEYARPQLTFLALVPWMDILFLAVNNLQHHTVHSSSFHILGPYFN